MNNKLEEFKLLEIEFITTIKMVLDPNKYTHVNIIPYKYNLYFCEKFRLYLQSFYFIKNRRS